MPASLYPGMRPDVFNKDIEGGGIDLARDIDDTFNQINLGLARLAGGPVDVTSWAARKIEGAITGKEPKLTNEDSVAGSQHFMNLFQTRDEEPQSGLGLAAQYAGEGVAATTGLLGLASKLQKTAKAGGVVQRVSESFMKEAVNNTARVMVAESGAALGSGLLGQYAKDEDLNNIQRFGLELFGAFLGAGTGIGAMSGMKRMAGKTPKNIIDDVVTGDIPTKDLPVDMKKPENVKALQDIKQAKSAPLAFKESLKAEDIDSFQPGGNPHLKKARTLMGNVAPTSVTGKEVAYDIKRGKDSIKAAEDLGNRVRSTLDNLEKAFPEVKEDFKLFLAGKGTPDSLKEVKPLLEQFRTSLEKIQLSIADHIEDGHLPQLSKPERKRLSEVIRTSVQNQNYSSTEYRMFTDSGYHPSKAHATAARRELEQAFLERSRFEGEPMSLAAARKAAKDHMEKLEGRSARQLKHDPFRSGSGSSVSPLKARSNPGPAEKLWLGEITDSGEQAFGTLSRTARTEAMMSTDQALVKHLYEAGIATKGQVTETQSELALRSVKNTGLFVEDDVAHAIERLYLNDFGAETSDIIANYGRRLWNEAVGLSKAMKVLANPAAYPVNFWSGAGYLVTNGIVPHPKHIARGFRLAGTGAGSLRAAANKTVLADLEDMAKYGLKPTSVVASDVRDSLSRGFLTDNLSKKIVPKGVQNKYPKLKEFKPLEKLGEWYSLSDTAFRWAAWQANQKRIKKMYPKLSKVETKAVAARWTNDTFQNYDMLADSYKKASRLGIVQPFGAFSGELFRNSYNTAKYSKQMIKGDFGKEFGLNPKDADASAMRKTGAKIAASALIVAGGGTALIKEMNSKDGISEERSKAFRETIAPDWDESKELKISGGDIKSGKYFNPSYLIPQMVIANAFQAGFSEEPFANSLKFFQDEFIGEGSFVFQNLGAALEGRDPRGKLISNSDNPWTEKVERASWALNATFEPGFVREFEKWEQALDGRGELNETQLLQRLVGVRNNNWDWKDSGFRFRSIGEKMNGAKSDYASAIKYGNKSPEEIDQEYQKMERDIQSNFQELLKHNKNLATWGISKEDRIQLIKASGFSGEVALSALYGTLPPSPRTVELSNQEILDQMSDPEKEIQILERSAPSKAKSLMGTYKNTLRKKHLTPEEQLFNGMGTSAKVRFLHHHNIAPGSETYNTLLNRGLINAGVEEAVKIKFQQSQPQEHSSGTR